MRTGKYRKMEKEIVAHDKGGIFERWRYGRLLLVDDEMTTPNGNLRHGVLDKLIRASERDGLKLYEREIQRRLQAAKRYPTEAQIRHQVSDFETWKDLVVAGFPEVPAPEGARPYDPRRTDDLVGQAEGQGRRLIENATQGNLFPQDEETTLGEIARWLDAQDEITRRFEELSQRRREQFAELVKAVEGDLTKTLGEARAALETE